MKKSIQLCPKEYSERTCGLIAGDSVYYSTYICVYEFSNLLPSLFWRTLGPGGLLVYSPSIFGRSGPRNERDPHGVLSGFTVMCN